MSSWFNVRLNALVVAAIAAGHALSAGATAANDSLTFSNAGTASSAGAANNSFFTLRIPATPDLPSNTVVAISSISIGSRNAAWNPDVNGGDAVTITVVGADGYEVRSDVATGFSGTIAVNEFTDANRITYTFTSPVRVLVGNSYDATLCHSNGNPLYWSSINNSGAGVSMVGTADDESVLSPKGASSQFDQGFYPVYEISGHVSDDVIYRYDNKLPTIEGDTFTSTSIPTNVTNASDWTGIIWLRNINVTDFNVNSYGNASSIVRLTGISGWLTAPGNYTYTNTVPIVLSNDDNTFALKIDNGNSANADSPLRSTAFVKIMGDGTIFDFTYAKPVIKVFDISEFYGDIKLWYGPSIVVCNPTNVYASLYDLFDAHPGTLRIESGKYMTVASGKTCSVKEVVSYGNLTVNGTLTASVAETFGGSIAGSGRIVASGFLPSMSSSPNIDLENWIGTFSLSNVAQAYPFNIHLFSSTNSTLELTSVGTTKAYLAGNVKAGKVVLTDDGDTHALALSDGLSDQCTTFTELAGTGTISQSNGGISQGLTINAMTNFTGTLLLNKMSVTFGTAQRTRSSGLYIDPDAVLSVPAGFELWSPAAVVIDGPVDFTTSETDYDGLVLFANTGSSVSYGEHAAFSINGMPLDTSKYALRRRNGQLLLRERQGKRITIR